MFFIKIFFLFTFIFLIHIVFSIVFRSLLNLFNWRALTVNNFTKVQASGVIIVLLPVLFRMVQNYKDHTHQATSTMSMLLMIRANCSWCKSLQLASFRANNLFNDRSVRETRVTFIFCLYIFIIWFAYFLYRTLLE